MSSTAYKAAQGWSFSCYTIYALLNMTCVKLLDLRNVRNCMLSGIHHQHNRRKRPLEEFPPEPPSPITFKIPPVISECWLPNKKPVIHLQTNFSTTSLAVYDAEGSLWTGSKDAIGKPCCGGTTRRPLKDMANAREQKSRLTLKGDPICCLNWWESSNWGLWPPNRLPNVVVTTLLRSPTGSKSFPP